MIATIAFAASASTSFVYKKVFLHLLLFQSKPQSIYRPTSKLQVLHPQIIPPITSSLPPTTMSSYENEALSGDVADNDYVSRTGQSTIPVQKHESAVEDPNDPVMADSDQQLGNISHHSHKEVF